MSKDYISTAAPPACFWPWHAFPFLFHHPSQDTPRAFFALGHTAPVPQSQERPQKRRRLCMPLNQFRKYGANSMPESSSKPPLAPPVTPPPKRPTAKNPLAAPAPTVVSSTPSRPGALASARGDSAAHILAAAEHEKWVKENFRDKIAWDIDPAAFIEGVWGPVSIPDKPFPNTVKTKYRNFRIDADAAEEWVKSEAERDSYEPLRSIMNDLIMQLCGEDVARLLPAFFFVHDRPHNGALTIERMDMVCSTVPRQGEVYTDFEHAFVEVKKEDKQQVREMKESGPNEWTRKVNFVVRPPKATSSPELKRKRDTLEAQGGLQNTERQSVVKRMKKKGGNAPVAAGGSGSGQHSTAGSRFGTPGSSAAFERTGKGGIGRELTDHEAQAVRYMNNLMSSNVRSFGIGMLIETDNMRLWYGDRMGLIVSKRFKWLKEDNWTFLCCIAAIARASAHGMGIYPSFRFPKRDDQIFFSSYEGVHISMLARRPDAEEAEELEFALDVKGPQVYAEFGLVGRGTSVVPAVAKPETKAHELFQDEELVVKVSWPHAARKSEDGMIIAVRKALKKTKPQYLPYIVDLKCSTTRTTDELALPRVAMNVLPDQSDLRVCRTLVMKRYQRLEMVESVDDFKKVFIDIVRVHHWVYETSHILHRDLSTNNIMWYRIGDKVYGVLCDWDLAEAQTDEDLPSIPSHEHLRPADAVKSAAHAQSDDNAKPQELQVKPRYRTGTGPFMAMDLLRPSLVPPKHLYRYDLESLFYILVCVCVALDLKKKAFRRLLVWEQKTLEDIGRNKKQFFQSIAQYREFFANCDVALRPLVEGKKSWAYGLWYPFSMIENLYDRILAQQVNPPPPETEPTSEGEEEAVKEVRGIAARGQEEAERLAVLREQTITYSTFMRVLGASKDITAS